MADYIKFGDIDEDETEPVVEELVEDEPLAEESKVEEEEHVEDEPLVEEQKVEEEELVEDEPEPVVEEVTEPVVPEPIVPEPVVEEVTEHTVPEPVVVSEPVQAKINKGRTLTLNFNRTQTNIEYKNRQQYSFKF